MSYTEEEHEQLILWNVPIWINLFNLKLRICLHDTSWHVLYKTYTGISYISAILSTVFPLALCAMECVPRILKERADIGVSKKILNYWWEAQTVQQACKSEFIVISVSGRGMVCKISNSYHHQSENKLSSIISVDVRVYPYCVHIHVIFYYTQFTFVRIRGLDILLICNFVSLYDFLDMLHCVCLFEL